MVAIVKLLLFIIYQTSFTYFDNCLVIYRFIFLLNVKNNAIHKNTIPTKLILPKNWTGSLDIILGNHINHIVCKTFQ